MLKVFPIDLIRAVISNQLKRNSEKILDGENYIGGETSLFNDNDIALFSFYENLTKDREVERYKEMYDDLINQQNKTDLIGFGIVKADSTPNIINLKSYFINPLEWSCTIRCNLGNRDKMIATLYEVIGALKGKKVDIASLDNGKMVVVGTIGDEIKDFDYIGEISKIGDIRDRFRYYFQTFGIMGKEAIKYVYATYNGKLHLFQSIGGDNWIDISENNVPEHNSFEKWKVDLSFDDLAIDQPYTMNAKEYCAIGFSGTATICENKIRLGNDIARLLISKDKIVVGEDDNGEKVYHNFTKHYYELEPLEFPSGGALNSLTSQLRSNGFIQNSHNDSIVNSRKYTFMCDTSCELIKEWFDYFRYNKQYLGTNGEIIDKTITPNIIYSVYEFISSWGEIEMFENKCKIVDSCDITNTESDTMTLDITFQLQGDNN